MAIALNQPIKSTSTEFERIAEDLQGNILKSHGRDAVYHYFLRFKDVEKARALIHKIAKNNMLTSAAKQKADSIAFKTNPKLKFKSFVSFSLSMEGYKFFGIDDAQTPSDPIFREGMKHRFQELNDPLPKNWQKEYQRNWHALLIIGNASLGRLKNQLKSVDKFLKDVVEEMYVEPGSGIRNKAGNPIEHFGYVDGISQPQLISDKVDEGKITTNNWEARGNLDLALVRDPGGKSEDSFGSYFVFRKLEQNVKAFKDAERDLAKKLDLSVDDAGAQIMGRFRSGNTLIPVTPPQANPMKMNDFNYTSDTAIGSKCPFHSHVRKTNPRENGFRNNLFVRRGITYGDADTPNGAEPTGGVGLLFMAYNSNLQNQFELMQRMWANNPGFPASGSGLDPVVGQGKIAGFLNFFKKWGDDSSATKVKAMGNFVTMKGGEYFFTPSISFLKNL